MRQKLNEARRRLVVRDFVRGSVWAMLAGLSALVALRGLVLAGYRPFGGAAVWLLGAPLLVAWGLAVFRWRSIHAVAREVDALAGTKDRFATGLRSPGESPWNAALHREIAAYAASLQLGHHLRLPRPGRRFLWLLLPLFAFAVLEVGHRGRIAGRAGELSEAGRMLEQARIAAKKDPELAGAAEELEKTFKSLPGSGEPLRDALRALAELERKLSEASGAAALSSAEAAALAEALAAEAPQLAGQLQSGDRQAAADSVAQLDPAALARALEQASKHLENRRLQELTRDRQAQQKLGTMLRASSGNGQARKKFLSDLRDIKQGGQGEPNEGGNPGGQDEPKEAPNGGEKPASGLADNTPPGGAPGSEKDQGQGAGLGGEKDSLRDAAGPGEFVAGQMAEGASLVEMLRAAGGDDPAARRAWKSAYQSAAPAALDAVAQEEIPPGSRLLVKRYFEAIRPKE